MRRGQRGGQREERTATGWILKRAVYTFKEAIFNKKGSSVVEGGSLTKRVVFN